MTLRTNPSSRIARLLALRAGRVCIAVLAIMYVFQRQFLYLPSGGEADPHVLGLPVFEAERLVHSDGASTVVWSAAADPGQPTILYFHGNGGGLQHRAVQFARLLDAGFGIFAMSYRGYSGSTGWPSEAANVADAVAAYDELRARGIAATDIVVYGESLGTGIAIQVAAQRDVRAVVLESSYSSITDVAANLFWYLPVRIALKDRYESLSHIKSVSAPILMLHGTADRIIPIEFSRRLARAAQSPVRYVEFPGCEHVNLLEQGALDDVRAFLARPTRADAAE
jgi:fermentation-respiration switch protein FrsA (DUF1100 family)